MTKPKHLTICKISQVCGGWHVGEFHAGHDWSPILVMDELNRQLD
jgi:hypothetical protein